MHVQQLQLQPYALLIVVSVWVVSTPQRGKLELAHTAADRIYRLVHLLAGWLLAARLADDDAAAAGGAASVVLLCCCCSLLLCASYPLRYHSGPLLPMTLPVWA